MSGPQGNQSEENQTRDVSVPRDDHIYRHFKLLTNGDDKALDALHIAYVVLNELEDGDDIEAALRYLIARFSVRFRNQIPQGGRYSEL